MLSEGLVSIGDIDPLGRHLRLGRHRDPLVQIALLAEDEELQAELEVHGIGTQTPVQVEPIQVRQAVELSTIYTQIGRNDKLALTGRPVRRLRSLTTSRVFRLQGETSVFLPSFLDPQQFYLTFDYHFLIAQIRGELAYIQRHWYQLGRPTVTLLLTHTLLESDDGIRPAFLELMQELRDGNCNGVQIVVGRLNQLLLTAGTERIDFLHDFEFTQSSVKDAAPVQSYLALNLEKNWPLSHTQEFALEGETDQEILLSCLRQSENLYEQIELLQTLTRLRSLEFDTGFGAGVTVANLIDEVYAKAGQMQLWAVVRRAAGLLHKVDIGLSDAVTTILVPGKQIAVGKAYSEAALITRPMSNIEITEKISHFCGEDIRDRVLSQEILIYLSLLFRSEPQLFKGLLTLRVSYLILLITSELARELGVTQDEAYEKLMRLAPFEVKNRLRSAIAGYEGSKNVLQQQESLHVKQPEQEIDWVVQPAVTDDLAPVGGWQRQRQQDGTLNRTPADFYPGVWRLLKHCRGLVIGDKLERRNRLDSDELLSEMTPGEKNFALRVEHLLNKIQAPEYRQVNVETLVELAAIANRNPNLQIEEYIVLDVLVGHAVRLAWLERFPERADHYDEHKAAAWRAFYNTSPNDCAGHVVKAFRFLTQFGSSS